MMSYEKTLEDKLNFINDAKKTNIKRILKANNIKEFITI